MSNTWWGKNVKLQQSCKATPVLTKKNQAIRYNIKMSTLPFCRPIPTSGSNVSSWRTRFRARTSRNIPCPKSLSFSFLNFSFIETHPAMSLMLLFESLIKVKVWFKSSAELAANEKGYCDWCRRTSNSKKSKLSPLKLTSTLPLWLSTCLDVAYMFSCGLQTAPCGQTWSYMRDTFSLIGKLKWWNESFSVLIIIPQIT